MATLGGIDLDDAAAGFDSGVAFPLVKPSPETLDYAVTGQGVVCLEEEGPYAVAKISSRSGSSDDVLATCTGLVEQALDELSVIKRLNLAIRPGLQEYLLWWNDRSGRRIVRYVAINRRSLYVSVHVQVTHADGSPGYQSIDVPVVNAWSVGLRYWRWSRLSSNAFDEFRNMYLALEDALSRFAPKQPGEREVNWLRRAICDLVKAYPQGILSAVCGQQSQEDWFMTNIYKNIRVKLFHAKDNRGKLVPGSSGDEATLQAMLPIVATMVQELWVALKLVTLPGRGVITNYGLQLQVKAFSEGCGLAVVGEQASGLPHDSEGHIHGDAMSMNSSPIVCNQAPWLGGAEGSCPVAAMTAVLPLQHILLTSNDTTMVDAQIDAPLDPTGFDEFQAKVAIQLSNGLF